MEILGIPPGPQVGAAYRFLLELRLDEGPASYDEAKAALLAWWAEQQVRGLETGLDGRRDQRRRSLRRSVVSRGGSWATVAQATRCGGRLTAWSGPRC